MAVALTGPTRLANADGFAEGTGEDVRSVICVISETLEAGVGRYVEETAAGLSQRGYRVVVLYSAHRADPAILARMIGRHELVCHGLSMPRAINWRDVRVLHQMSQILKNYPDLKLIHGHSSKGGAYARLLGVFFAIPAIYTPNAFVTQSPDLSRLKRHFYVGIERILAKLTHTIVCVSQAEMKHASGTLGIGDEKLRLIPTATTRFDMEDRGSIRQQLGIGDDEVVIGFIGRMVAQKAPERFIAALRILLGEVPSVRAVIVGDGPKRAGLERQLEEVGLSSRVTFLGAVEGRRYLRCFDIFALTSRYEGFAYVLLEALEAELPVVSTPVGGTDETISEGVNGYIVPHDDPRAMSDALRRLALDPQLRISMSAAARSRRLDFEFPRVIDQIQYLYSTANPVASHAKVEAGYDKHLTATPRTDRVVSLTQAGSVAQPRGRSHIPALMRNMPNRNIDLKRQIDVLGAVAGILFFGPIMCLIALALLLSGSGVIFRHNRIGQNGTVFTCFKFRTMMKDGDSVLHQHLKDNPRAMERWRANHKLAHDPRVTWFGRFLRSTSLDELPQLFNVLKGEMSLVGPRPIVAEEIPKYASFIRYYYSCKPGLTGLWQVSGRNNVRYSRRVCLDAMYVRRKCFLFDVAILFRTIGVVLSRNGAF